MNTFLRIISQSRIIILFLAYCLVLQTLSSQNQLKTIIIDPGHGLPDPGASGEFSQEYEVTLPISKKIAQLIRDSLRGVRAILTRETNSLPGGFTSSVDALYFRADFANEEKGDLFISIHADSRAPIYKKIRKGNRTIRVKMKDTIKGATFYILAPHKTKDKDDAILDHIDIVNVDSNEEEELNTSTPYAVALASSWTKNFFKRSLVFATMVDEQFKQSKRKTYGVKQRRRGIWVLQATSMPSILIETGYMCTPEEEIYLNSPTGQYQTAYYIFKAIKKYKKYLEEND